MSDWNERANEIFLAAMEIIDPVTRARYVAEACGDDADLRKAVAELLQACAESSDFLVRPLARLPEELLSVDLQLMPERVGRYKVLEEIGEGGMGVVYRAMQEAPVQRQVALKIIKPGIDTRQTIARFQAERQVLAMMQHPNIAHVLDAGATETGRPYFVMELVSGVPITQFCDEQKLGRAERLRLFIDVCAAVQHAHQKGIIHRDIKPSNILVSVQDQRPVVKVIDFGVAKAIGPEASNYTQTSRAQWVGTPLYMSPEQASLTSHDIDTRSDVYSLGVVLYELLTGTTPVAAETLGGTDETEKRRIICEYEPPYPSLRVTKLDSKVLARVTGEERADVHRISRQLRGELDWIVMKALEKDRDRRYASVSALTADIHCYLNDEPVSAGPPSQLYRLRKLAWRNRRALAAGVAVLLALVTGTTVAIWQAIEATRAQRIADAERDRAVASEAETRRMAYAGDMRLAVDAWKSNDVRQMREILARQMPRNEDEQDLRDFGWYFLNQSTAIASRELLQSPMALYCVTVSADGRHIAACGKAPQIHLFDAASLKPTGVITTPEEELNALAFSSDSKTLYSCCDDGSVSAWDVKTRKRKKRERTGLGKVFGLTLNDQQKAIVLGGETGDLEVRDQETLALRETLKFHTATIQALASSKSLVAAASDDSLFSAWNLQGSTPVWRQAATPPSRVNNIAFSADGQLVATAHMSGVITVRTAADGGLLHQQMFSNSVHSLALTPAAAINTSGSWIAVGDRNGSVHLLPGGINTMRSGLLLQTDLDTRHWQAHEDKVYSLAFSVDGRRLLSAGDDGRLIAWDYATGTNARRLPFDVNDFVVIGEEEVATIGDKLRITSLIDDKTLITQTARPSSTFVRYAPESKQLFFRDGRDQIRSLKLGGPNKSKLEYRAAKDRFVGIFAMTSDGRQLAMELISSDDAIIEVELPGKENRILFPCTNQLHQMGYTPDGKAVVFDQVKDLLFVDPETGKVLQTLIGHKSTISDFAFSPDGDTIATVSSDRTVRVWDWRSGKQLWSATAHDNEASAVAFAADGATIATTGQDGRLRLWRWRQNTRVFDYQLIDWPVNSIAFAGNGRKLIVEADYGIRIYDASGNGKPDLPTPPAPAQPATAQ